MEKLSNKRKKIFADIIRKAKMVDGVCPHCTEHSLLIGIVNDFYRCMNCGGDIEQKVNGKISYLPIELKEYEAQDVDTPEDWIMLELKYNLKK